MDRAWKPCALCIVCIHKQTNICGSNVCLNPENSSMCTKQMHVRCICRTKQTWEKERDRENGEVTEKWMQYSHLMTYYLPAFQKTPALFVRKHLAWIRKCTLCIIIISFKYTVYTIYIPNGTKSTATSFEMQNTFI